MEISKINYKYFYTRKNVFNIIIKHYIYVILVENNQHTDQAGLYTFVEVRSICYSRRSKLSTRVPDQG